MHLKLEEEIKQKSFRSLYEKLAVNILYTGSWMNMIQTSNLKPFKLTLPQYNVLRILRGQHPDPVTVNTIIDRMLDKSSNASRIVDRLTQKGLALRKVCQSDKRAVDVTITQKGLDLLKQIDEKSIKWEEQYHSLTKIQAEKLNELLDKLRSNDYLNYKI